MGFKLTIEQGHGRGQSFDFAEDEITIGRTEENDVVLFEQGVSRRHARISFDGSRHVLVDLDSANGTLLNGNRVAREVLEDGDTIGIGAVTFRFNGPAAAAASAGASATRIVSEAEAKKPEKRTPPPGTAAPRKPAAPAPAAGASPRALRLLLLAGLGVLLVGVVALLWRGKADDGRLRCTADPFTLDESVKPMSFGVGGVDVDCPDYARFGFMWSRGTRAILHFASSYTDKGEVAVVLNDAKVGDLAIAPTARTMTQQLTLPEKQLKEGANVLEFRYGKGDERWQLRAVELEVIGLNEADLDKATQEHELGTRLLQRRNVAARNLYDAWMHLKEARRHMEGLEPKPDLYAPTLTLIRDLERDLDKLCERRMFEARRLATYEQYERANEVYRSVLATFPGEAHPCRQRALQNMYEFEGGGGE